THHSSFSSAAPPLPGPLRGPAGRVHDALLHQGCDALRSPPSGPRAPPCAISRHQIHDALRPRHQIRDALRHQDHDALRHHVPAPIHNKIAPGRKRGSSR
ncbi:unnamed protein product, partial [Urochloa humidicola]